MDLYDRSFDPQARITSAAQHLSAAAARLALSMVRSVPHLPEATWGALQPLLHVEVLWSLCLVLAGWLIATTVGGLVGLAVNALLLIYGLVELWDQLKEIGSELHAWALAAYQAQSDKDLDLAAQHFAKALSEGGIALLAVLVTHRVFRAVSGKLRTHFPTPEWLKAQYEEAVRQRGTRPKPEAARLRESPLQKRLEGTVPGVQAAGAKRLAEELPTAALVLGGAVLAVGTVAGVAWAVRSASAERGHP